MKSKFLARLIAVILCAVLAFSGTLNAFANYVTASLTGNSVTSAQWMSSIDDSTKISDISLPGTHDSGTKWINTPVAGAWTTTQDLTIPQQLEAGVRYLDIRLAYDDNVESDAKVMHSSIECLNENDSNMTFKDVCRYLKEFLDANPTETVVVSVKQDAGDAASALANALQTEINEYSSYWYTGTSTPTLGKVRGKAVIAPRMREFSGGIHMDWSDQGSDGTAQNYTWYQVQDRYNMGADTKWSTAAKPMLDEEKANGVWYINFLSTTGGGISGVSANAGTMNGYFNSYAMQNNKCYGVVAFDYVTEDLAKKVYKCNDLVSKNQPDNSSGQYYYRVNLNTTQNVADGWSSVWMKLYYKENNGTGAEKSILLFENGDTYNGYYFVCNVGDYDFSGVVDGFPTKVEFHFDWGYGAKTLTQTMNLYVGASPSGTMVKCATNSFSASSTASTPYKGTETYSTTSSLYPRATSIAFDSASSTIGVPATNSIATNKYTYNANVYDQYGVKWYKAPTSYSLSENYEGVSLIGNAIYTDYTANDNAHNAKFNICAEYSDSSVVLQNKKILTLNTNPIEYQFLNQNGDLLQSGSDYAGTVPTYNGDTPTLDSTSTVHYTFREWDNISPLSLSNTTYTAKYTASQHSINSVEHSLLPTCTEKGYDTYKCSCGYSWKVDVNATGHDMVTTTKDATCTADGYYRIECSKCGYVQYEQTYPALGHDYENAVEGDVYPATSTQNGYKTYLCPRCNVELESLRVYDSNDWSGYNEALKAVEDIKNDTSYSNYDGNAVSDFENSVTNARAIENNDERLVLQADIDNATSTILTAIDTFGNAVGVTYYQIVFVKADGTTISTRYKEGTAAANITKPANTPYLITNTNHTVYKWGNVKAVSGNATYSEYSVTTAHSFNTYIFPDEVTAATCTSPASTKHKCLCGYEYTEVTGTALGHNYSDWQSNGDGTHTKTCANDLTHSVTELCDLTNGYKCPDCGYSLDVTTYASIVVDTAPLLGETDIYTAASLENLRQSLANANSNIKYARTQTDVDNLVSNIQTAKNSLTKMPYSIYFQYIYGNSDDTTIVSPGTYCCEAGIKTFTLPQGISSTSYKWVISTSAKDEGIFSSSNTFDANITSDAIITCYLLDTTTDNTKCELTILQNGRAKHIDYVAGGNYTVNISSDSLTIGDNTYNAKLPFYTLTAVIIDGKEYMHGDSITINGDTKISLKYTPA